MRQKRNYPLILFFLIYLVFIVPIFIWLFLDHGLPQWDMGRHLYDVLQYQNIWKQFFVGEKNIFGVAGFYAYYPPFAYQLTLAFFMLFGVSAKVAVLSNIIWIFILFFSVYQISLRIYKNQLIALASIIFLAAAPLLIGQVREFQLDLQLTAMVALSFWLILRTEKFSALLPSLLFGLVFGLGMLTKWVYIFYALPLIIVFLIYSIIIAKDKTKVFLYFVYAMLVAVSVSGYWYITNRQALWVDFNRNGVEVAQMEGDPTGITAAALIWYSKRIIENYLFLPLFIIYLAGLSWALIKKEWRAELAVILIVTPIYYLIFSILPNKDTRYLMPVIPLLAITGVCAFNISKSKYYQIGLVALLAAIFVVNNLNIAFSKNLSWKNNNIYLFGSRYMPLISSNGYTTNSPRAENCPIVEVMTSIPEEKTVRLFGPNLIDYNNWMVAFYSRSDQKIWAGEIGDYLQSNYLIYRNKNISEPNIAAELKNSGKIKLINTYDCADGGRVELYKTVQISNN